MQPELTSEQQAQYQIMINRGWRSRIALAVAQEQITEEEGKRQMGIQASGEARQWEPHAVSPVTEASWEKTGGITTITEEGVVKVPYDLVTHAVRVPTAPVQMAPENRPLSPAEVASVHKSVTEQLSQQLTTIGFRGYTSEFLYEQLFGAGRIAEGVHRGNITVRNAIAEIGGNFGKATIDLSSVNAFVSAGVSKDIRSPEQVTSDIAKYLTSIGIGGDIVAKTLAAIQTTPATLQELVSVSTYPTPMYYTALGGITPSALSRYPNLAALGFKEADILRIEAPASAARARYLRLALQTDYLSALEKLPFDPYFYAGTPFTSVKEAVLSTQVANLSQLTGKAYTPLELETIYKTQAIGTEVILPRVPKSFSELGLGEAVGRAAPLVIQLGVAYGGGLVLGAVSKTLAPVAEGVTQFVGKADIFARLATHVSPAVQSMWAVQMGAIKIAAPYIAQQVGLIAFTGLETYKVKTMYEAGAPLSDIALSVGTDVATIALFAKGFQKGYELGLPSRIERALVGKEKLFIKGEYIEFPSQLEARPMSLKELTKTLNRPMPEVETLSQAEMAKVVARGNIAGYEKGDVYYALYGRDVAFGGQLETGSILLTAPEGIYPYPSQRELFTHELAHHIFGPSEELALWFEKEMLFANFKLVEVVTPLNLPSISYPTGATAFFKRTGGLLSKLTAPYGELHIEAGMVLPSSAIDLTTGAVSKEWGLVSSMRLQQVETWVKVQPFKLGVPLETGTEIIDSRLIGVQALGDTQSIRYWSGVSAKTVKYTPFGGELFEPWTLTKTNLVALKTYILAPKELVATPAEGWAQIQMNVARTIYPAGVLYPERPIGILDKEWYTTKMYDVGRAMDQITSMYITTPGRVVGESFAKIQFELTPAQTVFQDFGGGGVVYSMDTEGVAKFINIGTPRGMYQKISDSIYVAGGGGGQIISSGNMALVGWPPRQVITPAMITEMEDFSPFMAHPLAAPSPLQKELPSVETILGVGVSGGLRNVISSRTVSATILKQIIGTRPALAQVPVPTELSAIVPVSAITQAQLLATIQAQILITPQITITPPTFAPSPTPTPPDFVPIIPPFDSSVYMFLPKKRKAKKGGKKYGERLWYVGPLEPKLPKLNMGAIRFVMPKIRKLNIKRFDRVKLPRQPMTKLPKTSMPKLPKLKLPRMKKMGRMV